jgi:1-acyl-sn-glycerol-3-phosphate acyltransferase
MPNVTYALGKALCQIVGFQTVRSVILHPERFDAQRGGFVLACSHLSHLEPVIVAASVRRKIDWMSRTEFYRYHLMARALDALDCFPVNRQRPAHSSIRTAINRVGQGRVVGIFPEGGVATGYDSMLRGGPFKKGACVVANRARCPILPVVVVGTEKLNRVGPWLPFRRARVWMIFGNPIPPRLDESRRRVARELLAADLAAQFQSLFGELCATCGLPDDQVGWLDTDRASSAPPAPRPFALQGQT